MRFHDLKEAPAGSSFIVWAVGPDNTFTKLGVSSRAAATAYAYQHQLI